MLRQLFLLPLASFIALSSVAYAVPKITQNQSGSFGIFEIVTCATPGSKSMELKTEEGKLEAYCIAAVPIITRTHVKKVESCHGKRGYEVEINLTEDGARLMEKATRGKMKCSSISLD
jgi:preprotein translocase subunit SecD